MMCFCCYVPLQGTVLLTPGAPRASSAHPAAMAWVKSCPPSLHHPLEGTWEWEAASQTYGLLSPHLAKGWCPHWWVLSIPLHTSVTSWRTFKCLRCRADQTFVQRLNGDFHSGVSCVSEMFLDVITSCRVACCTGEAVTLPRTICQVGFMYSVQATSEQSSACAASSITTNKMRAETRLCCPGVKTRTQLFLFTWETLSHYNNVAAGHCDCSQHLMIDLQVTVMVKKTVDFQTLASGWFPTLRVAGVARYTRKMAMFGK